MDWLNIYGLITMIIIMVPNIIFAIKEKSFESKYNNKIVEFIEQIGRFGSMGLMIFNIPLLDYGYFLPNGKVLYVFLSAILSILYCIVWFLYFIPIKWNNTRKNIINHIINTFWYNTYYYYLL